MCLASSGVVQCGRRRFGALLVQSRTQNVTQLPYHAVWEVIFEDD